MSSSRGRTTALTVAVVLVLGLASGGCSGSDGDASGPPPSEVTDTTVAGAGAAVVEAGGYTLTPVDPAAVGIEAQIDSPEVQAIAEDVTLAVVSRDGRNVGLALRLALEPDLRGRPDVVDRFMLAAASGAPVEKTEVAGHAASTYTTVGDADSPRSQIVLATSSGDLLVFIGTDRAGVAAMADAVVPVLDTGDHE